MSKIFVGVGIAFLVLFLYYITFLIIQRGLLQFGVNLTAMQGVAIFIMLFFIRLFLK